MKQTRCVKVLVNPMAGGQKAKRLYPAVVDRLRAKGLQCDVTLSRYPGELTELAAEIAGQGHDTIVACGGDGTANEIVNGLVGSETALAMVPVGTANDFAVKLGINEDLNHTCEAVKKGRTREIDLVRINQDRFFCGTACLGFDGQATAFSRSRKADPHLIGVVGGLVKFFSCEPRTVELRFDGRRFFGEAFLVAFGNIRSCVRGGQVTPDAFFDDALLDICLVRRMPKRKRFSIFPSVFRGSRVENDGIEQYQTKAVFVQSVGNSGLYADGDFVVPTPVRLEVVPKALKVVVGSSLGFS